MSKKRQVLRKLVVLAATLAVVLSAHAGPALAMHPGVTARGVLEKPGATTYQYGTHAITDEASGTRYALQSENVDLDASVGERVAVHGVPSPGYEDGRVEGGPTLLNVVRVEPADGPDQETVTVTFELTIEGEAPEGSGFFLSDGRQDVGADAFCSATTCEDGGTYSVTKQVTPGNGLSYEYYRADRSGPPEFFAADTRTFFEDETVSATYRAGDPEPPKPGQETVTTAFELAVECDPPAGTTFFGHVGDESYGYYVPLADPDNDGVYTGSQDFGKAGQVEDGPSGELPFQIVQGTGSEEPNASRVYSIPGDPVRTIKDFGLVKLDENKTLSASVSFCNDSGGLGNGSGSGSSSGNSGGSASGGSGSSSAGSGSSSGGAKTLPATGGALPIAGLLGAMLVGGGLLARRIAR